MGENESDVRRMKKLVFIIGVRFAIVLIFGVRGLNHVTECHKKYFSILENASDVIRISHSKMRP